jgi:hypothetical protein
LICSSRLVIALQLRIEFPDLRLRLPLPTEILVASFRLVSAVQFGGH